MESDTQKWREYFLGGLQSNEAEEIEQRIISDPKFEEDLIVVENDLIEDHLDGTLSAVESRLFVDNYLITPDRHKNVELVAHLRERSKIKEQVSDADGVKDDPSFIERFKFSLSVPRLAYAPCLLLLIGITLGYFWFGQGDELQPSQSEYAVLNAQDFSSLVQYKDLSGIELLPGSSRGMGSAVKATDLSSRSNIFFRLGLPIELKDHDKYDLTLRKDRKSMFRFESLKAYENGGGKELRLLLPGSTFTEGGYLIEVNPAGASSTPLLYYFTVE